MSGKLFKNLAQPIDASVAVQVQTDIINKINKQYPELHCLRLGSVGHKSEPSGDIDIGIPAATVNDMYDIIQHVFGDDCIKIESLYIVSIVYKYDDNKYVQCDFIQVVDEQYTEFRYYCPDYTKGESQYKVGHRIMFLNMILNHCNEAKFKNVANNEYPKFDFSPIGLYRDISERNNILKYIRTDFITTDVDEIISMMAYNPRCEDFNTVESLWAFIHSDNFKYSDTETPRMEITFFMNCYMKGWTWVQPEDFQLQYTTVEQIRKYLKYIEHSVMINRNLQNGAEK